MDSIGFVSWLSDNFSVHMPADLSLPGNMEKISEEMIKVTGWYSYLLELLSFAKIYSRELKRNGTNILWEDMVDKREAIDNKLKALKQCYDGMSRIVTIRTENNYELRMLGGKYTA